ncbi:hypothetical protein BHE74_00031068, partial [Ensete ventricosum]
YSARQFEVVTGAEVARHTRKQSEGGGSVRGEAALVLGDAAVVSAFGLLFGAAGRVKRRRAGWHLPQEEQSTGRYHYRNAQHKMQALVDDSTWQISLSKCHTNGV